MSEEESDREGAPHPGAADLPKMLKGWVETLSRASFQAPGAAQEHTALWKGYGDNWHKPLVRRSQDTPERSQTSLGSSMCFLHLQGNRIETRQRVEHIPVPSGFPSPLFQLTL